jgi:hypothetical protein
VVTREDRRRNPGQWPDVSGYAPPLGRIARDKRPRGVLKSFTSREFRPKRSRGTLVITRQASAYPRMLWSPPNRRGNEQSSSVYQRERRGQYSADRACRRLRAIVPALAQDDILRERQDSRVNGKSFRRLEARILVTNLRSPISGALVTAP